MNQKINIQFAFLCLIIVMAAFSRLIPHPANFAPLAAIGLFGAAHFARRWQAWLIPILATWVSDLFINNVIYAQYYAEFSWFYEGAHWMYGAYLLIVFLGLIIFKYKISILKLMGGALGASVIFFLLTNFGVWAGSVMYPKTLAGLISCFVAGVPFFGGTIMGNLFYTSVLFGGYYLLQRQFEFLRLNHVKYH